MSTRKLLIDTAGRIFEDCCSKESLDDAERGSFPEDLWQLLRDNGLHQLAMRDSGVDLGDAFALIKHSGRFAVPLPILELTMANRWLGGSDRFVSIGVVDGSRIVGVPWGRRADSVLGVRADGPMLLVDAKRASWTNSTNPAGEARDTVSAAGATEIADSEQAWEVMALGRALLMAGCLERVLELSVRYVNERKQFGRTLAKFQAIQHSLAIMAAEVAASSCAADAAAAALDAGGRDRFALAVAAAKARVGEACGAVAEIAHQVHGAIGFTHEHQLHHFTRRLWSWRDEYGSEPYWQRRLGRHISARGADRVWDFVTRGT